MKSRMFVMVCTVLVLALLKSTPCIAQAEIDPDHFDTQHVEMLAKAQTIDIANPAAGFQGRFTLLHEISCQGKTLPAGTYSLSILPREGWNLVTFTSQGAATNMQTHMKSSRGSGGPTALIVKQVGGQSVLTGISLEKPGTMLYTGTAPSHLISSDSEVVPILSATRSRPEK